MKILITIVLLIVSLFAQGQSTIVTPKVDERTELLSIVFRLAESPEYMGNYLPSYVKNIDSCFAPFKNHEVVRFAKTLRRTRRVMYAAVMSMAICIEIKDSIRLRNGLSVQSLDDHWGKKSAAKFIMLLNKFYTETGFHTFFTNHVALRSVAEQNFAELLTELDFSWFEKFYGVKNSGSYNLVISLANGMGNYGPSVHFNTGQEEIYAIIGTWRTDSLGQPIYPNNLLPTLIHEYNHSYCNPLMEAFYGEMKSKTNDFYKQVSDKMRRQAYGSAETMNREILVRACVIKYLESKGASEQKVRQLTLEQKGRGFLWIEELLNLLSTYEKNRDKYPSLQSFMPEVIKLQASLSPKQLKTDFESQCARIVFVSIKNKSKNIDPKTTELIVRFDRPMDTGSNGINYGKKGKAFYPERPKDLKSKWNEETKMEWVIPITLKPNTKYSLALPSHSFRSENFYSLNETYYLDFTTGKN